MPYMQTKTCEGIFESTSTRLQHALTDVPVSVTKRDQNVSDVSSPGVIVLAMLKD